MKKLVVVADDVGFSIGTTDGAIKSMLEGVVSELSAMVWSPGTAHASQEVKKNNISRVGIHITLNNLLGTGAYMRTNDYKTFFETASDGQIKQKVTEEFAEFERAFGAPPTHITSHQHVASHPRVADYVLEFARQYNIPIRRSREDNLFNARLAREGIHTTTHVFAYFFESIADATNHFVKDLSTVQEGESAEIILHPGYVDDVIMQYSSMRHERERDITLATDKHFREKIQEMGFEIVDYSSV
jgi:chitin disaccharide deacetylase